MNIFLSISNVQINNNIREPATRHFFNKNNRKKKLTETHPTKNSSLIWLAIVPCFWYFLLRASLDVLEMFAFEGRENCFPQNDYNVESPTNELWERQKSLLINGYFLRSQIVVWLKKNINTNCNNMLWKVMFLLCLIFNTQSWLSLHML